MSQLELWFPVGIYKQPNLLTEKENKALINRALTIREKYKKGRDDWRCSVYNTLGSHDILKDRNFNKLISLVTHHVNDYIKMHGSEHKYKCQEGWLNIYKQGDYQEYHTHEGSTISAVYYMKSPEDSSNIVFRSPHTTDMLPIKNIKELTNLSYKTCYYEPEERSLLIFRSYIPHMVEQHKGEEERISLAFNF